MPEEAEQEEHPMEPFAADLNKLTIMRKNLNVEPSQKEKSSISSHGPVAILWDIENCRVPADVRPEDVAGNVRMALRSHPVVKGAVTMFSAYGDFNAFPRRLREGCQRTGVKLIDVPNGRKDAADKAILIDMFLFALDNRPPSSIMLISGDVDFALALHVLGQRGYTMILVIPYRRVSSALINAGTFVWDWPSIARGDIFVGSEEEPIMCNPTLQQSLHDRVRSQSLPCGLNEASMHVANFVSDLNAEWVQPGDLSGLKRQLVKLLEVFGGCLSLDRVHAEYQKLFGRPLYVKEYKVAKLASLVKKFEDCISIEGVMNKKIIFLRSCMAGTSMDSLVIARRDRERGYRDDTAVGGGSSDEFSEEERVVVEEHIKRNRESVNHQSIQEFRHELEEILVSYSCRIFLGCFEAIYQQRYGRPLDLGKYGVGGLEELFEKVRDVVVLHEEPVSKIKFLCAIGM